MCTYFKSNIFFFIKNISHFKIRKKGEQIEGHVSSELTWIEKTLPLKEHIIKKELT